MPDCPGLDIVLLQLPLRTTVVTCPVWQRIHHIKLVSCDNTGITIWDEKQSTTQINSTQWPLDLCTPCCRFFSVLTIFFSSRSGRRWHGPACHILADRPRHDGRLLRKRRLLTQRPIYGCQGTSLVLHMSGFFRKTPTWLRRCQNGYRCLVLPITGGTPPNRATVLTTTTRDSTQPRNSHDHCRRKPFPL